MLTTPIAFAVLVALAPAGSPDLLQRALDPNPGLTSYTASVELRARTHPIPLQRTFHGTATYIAPTRTIVFDDASGATSRFKTLTTTTPSWAEAQREYTIGPPVDDGTVSTFTLMPRTTGRRVTSIVVAVADSTALAQHVVYHYVDGGVMSFDEHDETLDGYHVSASIDISARFPGYAIDATVRFTGYRLNVPIPAATS